MENLNPLIYIGEKGMRLKEIVYTLVVRNPEIGRNIGNRDSIMPINANSGEMLMR